MNLSRARITLHLKSQCQKVEQTMQTDNTQHGQNQAYSSLTPTCTISCGQITDKFMIHCSKCQQWTIEEIPIFSNSSHLEWKVGLSDTILKGTHPVTTPARFSVRKKGG
jgi:hypothetical protein